VVGGGLVSLVADGPAVAVGSAVADGPAVAVGSLRTNGPAVECGSGAAADAGHKVAPAIFRGLRHDCPPTAVRDVFADSQTGQEDRY